MSEIVYSSASELQIPTGIERAIERGVAFLESRQLASGEVPVLTSCDAAMRGECIPDPSVFPTALVANALASTPRAHRVHARALDFLLREMDEHGLWRHWTREHPGHAHLPPDLDDTAMASAALVAAGRAIPPNRELLLANRDRRGLFFTWITLRARWTNARHQRIALAQLRHPLILYSFVRRTSAAPNDVDAVVNANVLAYLGVSDEAQPVVTHLMGVLRGNHETTCDKWYESPFAVWYFFSRALRGIAPEAGAIIMTRMAATPRASALEHALAACVSMWWDRPADDDIRAILDAQLETGGWLRAGLYYGGRKRRRDGSLAPRPPGTPHWGSEELTTAFCIEALSLQLARS